MVFALTVALAMGLSISTRIINSIKRISSSDSGARAISAAEGGIEWFLRQPVSVLENLSDGDSNNGNECPKGTNRSTRILGGCVVTYRPAIADKVQSQALITIRKFSTNYSLDGVDQYRFTLDTGSVKEVRLEGYAGEIQVCWRSLSNSNSSGLYYVKYNDEEAFEKRIIAPFEYNGNFVVKGEFINADQGRLEYSSCALIEIEPDTLAIRLKSLYAPSRVGVIPLSGNLPYQGYQITSLGQMSEILHKVPQARLVTAYRSFPYTPSIIDYGIYTPSELR